jgi:Ca2+-transporting ATPase
MIKKVENPVPDENISLKEQWYSLTNNEIYNKLDCCDQGLSQEQVDKRLLRYGNNELKRKQKISFFKILVHQFCEILNVILFIIGIVNFIFITFDSAG